jgi:hypothetical protein
MRMACSSDLLEAALPDCRASEFLLRDRLEGKPGSLGLGMEALAAGVVVGSGDIAFE